MRKVNVSHLSTLLYDCAPKRPLNIEPTTALCALGDVLRAADYKHILRCLN